MQLFMLLLCQCSCSAHMRVHLLQNCEIAQINMHYVIYMLGRTKLNIYLYIHSAYS